MTTFGRFDDAAREYVITRPDTPLPWINYLGSEDYFGIISNTAGGYSFFRDAPAPAPHALPVQQRTVRRGRALPVPPRFGQRGAVVAVVATGARRAGGLPVPARPRLHGDRRPPGGHRCRDALLRTRSARRWRSGGPTSPTGAPRLPSCRCSARSSSACGTPGTTPPTSSATSRSAKSRWTTASSTTRPSTGSAATTLHTSPAPPSWRASTPNATPSSAPTGAGSDRWWPSRDGRATRSPMAGRRAARTTSS